MYTISHQPKNKRARVKKFVVLMSTLYTEKVSLDKCVRMNYFSSPDAWFAVPRPIAVACGPIIGCGQVWETGHAGSILAGVAKNHADQVPETEWSSRLFSLANEYAKEEALGFYDAAGTGERYFTHAWSSQEVLDNIALVNPTKSRRYGEAHDLHLRVFTFVEGMCKKAVIKVKREMLKWGKPPRVITEFESGETVEAHQYAMPLEKFIKTRLSWKGLKTSDKCTPFRVACELFDNDCYIVCLDDVARDSNTTWMDLMRYALLLAWLGIWGTGQTFNMMFRRGVRGRTLVGILMSLLYRLFSGESDTSGRNWTTSRAMWSFLRRHMGLTRMDFVAVCEGDDNFAALKGAAVRELGLEALFTDEYFIKLGRLFGKVLKVEKQGWLRDRTAWPAVGGDSVYLDGLWSFIPSQSRGIIKAGWAISTDFGSYASMAGRVTARAWALNDRYDGVPIFWAYARVVAAHAASLKVKALFDSDELFLLGEEGWTGDLAAKPTLTQRDAYFVATGLDCGVQTFLEKTLLILIEREDYCADLTHLFSEFVWSRE